MGNRNFLWVAALVFGMVSLGHLIRVISGWAVTIDSWNVPLAVSWVGLIFSAGLCVWAISLAIAKDEGAA